MSDEVTTVRIPAPDGTREVRKANVFEAMIGANSELLPLFPYVGPGSIVPCLGFFRGGPEAEYGRFFHENTQEEISVVFGASEAMLSTGRIFANGKLHGVNSYLKNQKNPDAYLIAVITQRQADDDQEETQEEAIHFRCGKCNDLLLRFPYDATPGRPELHGGSADDRFPSFSGIWGSSSAVHAFNGDEDMRTCKGCGTLNPPFPVDKWGWHAWVSQREYGNAARKALVAAGEDS